VSLRPAIGAVAAALLVLPGAAAARPLRDADGIHVVSEQALDSRLLAVTVSTSALPAPADVRILLPSGYASHPRRRYPVLYLLHGTSGGAADEVNWAAHDPATLANNLRGMNLFLYTGNGVPGPLDMRLNPGGGVIEGGVEQLTALFHQRLDVLGIASYYDDYGPGTHSWPYWARDLRQSIGPITYEFAHPPPPPARITYTSADGAYSAFGWQVTMHRYAREFSTLARASSVGFTISGSGSATVVTPPLYERGASYSVTAGGRRSVVRVASDHRLTITVRLGPSDILQEYPLDGPPLGTNVYTTSVSIARLFS
jgi:hypothetical protein